MGPSMARRTAMSNRTARRRMRATKTAQVRDVRPGELDPVSGSFVYAVRCNFARPDLEAAWNQWYSGPKLDEMLAKPLFLSVQRFAATSLDQSRRYLALWLVASPDAFTTP